MEEDNLEVQDLLASTSSVLKQHPIGHQTQGIYMLGKQPHHQLTRF